jgi:hypothetical protein
VGPAVQLHSRARAPLTGAGPHVRKSCFSSRVHRRNLPSEFRAHASEHLANYTHVAARLFSQLVLAAFASTRSTRQPRKRYRAQPPSPVRILHLRATWNWSEVFARASGGRSRHHRMEKSVVGNAIPHRRQILHRCVAIAARGELRANLVGTTLSLRLAFLPATCSCN